MTAEEALFFKEKYLDGNEELKNFATLFLYLNKGNIITLYILSIFNIAVN